MTRQYYPLTHPQKRIWFGEKLTPGYDFANIAFRIAFQGVGNPALLSQAVNRIVEKNTGLRLHFVELEGEGDALANTRQYVADYQPVAIPVIDLPTGSLAEVDDWCLAESAKPFQLLDADLYQFAILKTADSMTLFGKFHHLIADGVSCWGPFVEQLTGFYASLVKKEGFAEKPIVSYLNFIEEEASYQASAQFTDDRRFWLDKFAAPMEEQTLYLAKGPASDISAASLTCKMPDELWQAFRQFSRQHKIPPFRLLLTGLYIYFARTSQRYDLLIDVAHHNRNNRAALQTIGMFVSTVPLRLTFDPECTFLEALRSISQELDTVLKGPQRFPYDLLAEELRAQHGTTLHSICSISQVRLPEGVHHYQNMSATTPLSLFIYPNGAMTFLFQRACFQAADIEALFSRLLTLLQDALAQPEQPLWQLNLLTTAEKKQLLQDFNATALPVPTDRTFPELFAEQVARTPSRLALAFRDERYTYQQLDAKTNALARVLQEHGVQPDVMVPILLHRSAEMLIAALAVMKAGGAYLPVDPDYPQPRIDFMLADSGATLLLSQQELREKAGAFTGVWLDVHNAAFYAGPAAALERSPCPEHLAYVIYTSGSTGQPKGVLIEQRNLVNLCAGENMANGTTAEDAFANHYSFSFDAAVSCLFPPLLVGAAVHIIPDELRLAPEALNAYLEEQNITIADFPTQFGEQFMQLTRNRSLRLMLMGGDRLKTVALQPYTLVNAYGPTECTVTATRFVIDRDDYASIPIGRPVANTQAYVVDVRGQLQPIGIPGELWLAGAQVARGYWNRPELTAEKFLPNPFATATPQSRIYRTGDVVRWRPDGLLEFIGRSDFQVKIRGFRIELGDIEAVLQQHPDVADAAVISGQNAAGADFISAHAVLRDRQFGSGDAAYVVATIDQDPTLEPRMEQEHAKSWPAFFAGDKMNARYWRKLYTTFPQLQFALLADDHIIAAGNMTPFHWSGAADDLPQGWDDALERSFREHQAGIAPNAVCVLAGVVSGERKGQNVSYELLRTMAHLAIATGHERIVLPVRPTLKTQYPHLSLQDYAALTRETDQLPFDPWLRVHTRLGGKILAYSEQSQRIEGTVAQWEEWTGQTFPVSGAYEIEGAMQPVMVDLAQDRGVYLDQAVWFEHDLNRYRDRRVCVTGRDGLRRFLAERLPDYMVPARIGIVAHIPTTTAGKVDRRALLATLPPEIAVERIAPRSEREHILARIWKEVLKLDDVGVNENFYHLGGDSIMSIQILSRARSQGLRIKGTDFFANPTIAGLAAAAETLTPTTHDRPAEGIAPLLPIQHWFFALGSPEPHHFNQAFCLKPGQPLEAAHLQSALDRVGRHHDALRLRFRRTATGDWEQRYAPLDGVIIRFTEVDLRPISEAKRVARRAELLNQLQCGFDLEQGPLAAAILVHGWTADEQRLLLAAHHLVVDVVSWRILLEDLESAYQALARGQSFTLPPRTAAYAEWGSALQRYADSPAGLRRQAEWAHITQHAPRLPRDRDAPLPSVQETATLTVSLPVALSAPLLEKPFGLYRARVNDVLLTALTLALFRWSGVRDGLLDLEGHGREEDLGPLDISRTVGWFTSLFPVRLRLPESQPFSPPFGKGGGGGILTSTDLVQALLTIKETLRAIPDNGISYGILRYLRGQPADEPNPELSFNYLGSLTGDDRAFLAFTDETVENIVSPATPMTHLLEIDGWETGGALTFLWRYSQAHFDRATIQALADAFRSSLEQLSSLFATAVVGAFSPADFPHTGLTQAHIDRFAAAGDIEDIYRLTPLQEGMLFQTCLHPEAGEYLNQTHWRFLESVDTLALRQAWSETMRRHPVFRSAFAWKDLPAPVQIVYADVDFEWVELDWRAVPENQFALRFQRFLEQDRRRGFDLRRPGLTRITYIRRPDGDRLIWTDHHILTDGWCLPLLINELDERYVALCERRAPHLESAPPFARMIDWLFQQNRREAEAFWRQQLGDLETPTRLGIEKPGVNLLDRQTAAEIHERERRFPATLSTRCTEFARQAGCTVNTILQTAWAVALAVTSGQKDLTFGMVSSGRPEELPGVERIIGLFISTAPLRIRLDDALPAREALQEIAQTSREVNRLGFIGLEQIRALSGVRPPTPLFHSLFAFENYPVSEFGGRPGGLRLGDIVAVERADMPLALILFPGEAITVRAAFDERLIEAAGLELLLDLYPQAIEGLLAHPDQALGALVEQLAQTAIQRLNSSDLQFSDAENWRRQRLAIAALRGQQLFWTAHLGAEPPVLRLIPDTPRTESTDDQVAQVDCPLTAATVQALRALAGDRPLAWRAVWLAAADLLLAPYAEEDAVIVGVPSAHHPLLETLMPVCNTLDWDETVAGFVEHTRCLLVECIQHADYPADMLYPTLPLVLRVAETPLPLSSLPPGEGTKIPPNPPLAKGGTEQLRLGITVGESDNGMSCTISYRPAQFQSATIERLSARFAHLLQQIAAHPDHRLGELDVLPAAERQMLLADFNATALPVPTDRTFPELFAEQVARTPDRLALAFRDERYTYQQLDAKTNALARVLREQGVQPDVIVPIMLHRSAEMLISALAIMKAGGAYLPIDPEYPQPRIDFMLADSDAEWLLSQAELREKAGAFAGAWLDVHDSALYAGSSAPLEPLSRPEHLAYIIYTSGSTGQPKGVMIEQRNLINVCFGENRENALTADDAIANYVSFSFDPSVIGLFPPLLVGAAVYLIPDELRLAPEALSAWLEEHGVTLTIFPTQFGEQFMQLTQNQSLRLLMVGGEKLKTVTPQAYTLLNGYGPTECTVITTRFQVNPADCANIPIGRPVANTQAYVVDARGQLQPIGAPGELWLGGAQVGRGYWNRAELTAEKFIANPFTDEDSTDRVYRTGDLVRWLPDGHLEFIGRRDFQIKIRGFRVELGEIEQALIQHPAVQEAAVIAREDPNGGHYLCGYYVSAPPVEAADIKAFLGRDLPAYLIPAFLIPLPALPVNAHGKVDRRALPEPLEDTAERPYLAPRNEIEEQLAGVWEAILNVGRPLNRDDDFFALGGNSLKIMALASRIEKTFGIKLALADLFNRPVLQDLAADIAQQTRRQRYAPIERLPESDYYPASAVQKRMYVLQSLPGIGATYNIPQTLLLEGALDSARLAQALDQLVERHETLRTRFTTVDGEIVQQVYPRIRYKKLFKEIPQADLDREIHQFTQPFDVSEAPLFRMALFKLAPERHLLLIDMHHSISDGASSQILFDELFTLYQGGALPPLSIQYRDFAAWQNQLLNSTTMQTHASYWQNALAGELPVLQLPTDRPRPAHQQFAGAVVDFSVDAAALEQLSALAQRAGATLFMLMLAAYQALLSRYAGQEDLITGTVASGRTHPDTENLIGMFVTTLPIRGFPQADKPFIEFLGEIRQTVLDALDHQDYPFDRMVENLHLPRDPSRNPLFTASFGFLEAEQALQAEQLTIRPYLLPTPSSHFDLTLHVGVAADRLAGYFNYATGLFDAATIQRMVGHFIRLLQQVADHPDIRLGDIEFLSAEERRQILVDFNATAWPVPTHRTFPELFAEQVARTPDRLALAYRDERYTYQQLDAKTNALARVLREHGVQPDVIAPIMLHRSAEMLIAALAIMKAGGAYLPVDPEYPQARIDFMLADSQACVLLSQTELREKAGAFTGVWLDVRNPALCAGLATPLEFMSRPEHLAYVIYTSGSTGQPKGVMIEQRNLINLCFGENRENAITADDAFANYVSFSFDPSVIGLFSPLLVGASAHLIPEELRLAPEALSAWFEEQGVTLAILPTQFGEQFMQLTQNRSLRILIVGGEKLKTVTPQTYTLMNEYGPTECTVAATRFQVDPAQTANIPIGGPLANLQAYVVNARGQLQPIGIPGELWLGGAQVGRGYWNRPELTAEKFIANPFADGDLNARVYRTGDIVRWRPDGTLEFSARQDFQVKIRGFRVELGEIEQAILNLPEVRETVVVALDDENGNKHLAGYLVAAPSTAELDFPALRRALQKALPDYMIPAHLMQLEQLPVTVHGKVDTRALPKPSAATEEIVRGYMAPRNELEQTLATVWATVLGVKNVGIHDNFFALGGNSLQAITVIARLQKHFAVAINDLYQWQTIAELAPRIKPRQDYLNLFLNELKENPEAWADPLAANPAYQAQLATATQQYRATWARYEPLDFTRQRHYSQFLLTGATGFLGAYLLHELLRQPEMSGLTVIVRGHDRADATTRLRSKFAYYFGDAAWDELCIADRITVLCGDLSQPQFGLSADEYQHWVQRIDGILNSAANVRHYGHYQEFYQANVQSVIHLIDFAQTGTPKDLHHISTLSVASGAFPDREYVVFTEDNVDEGQVSGNHYLATKLAAEKLLIDRRMQGLNASIYRVGNIVFSQETGRYQENIEDNGFFSQVQSFVNLGVTPAMKDDIDFTYVDSLAQAILRLMQTAELRNETYHLANPRRIRLSEVLTDPNLGLAVRTAPFADFVETLLNHLEQRGFSRHIENILTHMGWLGGDMEQQTLVTQLSDRTGFLLERLGFVWPELKLPNLLPMIRQALAERIAFLEQTPLFAQLPAEPRAILAGQATLTAFRNEKPLVWEGDPADALYLVMDGFLEISSTSTSGWTGTLGILSEKDFVGEESLFPGKRVSLTAEALLGDVVALRFPGEALRATIQQHPQLALNLLEALETRLQRLAKLLISIS